MTRTGISLCSWVTSSGSSSIRPEPGNAPSKASQASDGRGEPKVSGSAGAYVRAARSNDSGPAPTRRNAKLERVEARLVEPLGVVHREQDRTTLQAGAHGSQHPEPDGSGGGRLLAPRAQQQRHLERLELRTWNRSGDTR